MDDKEQLFVSTLEQHKGLIYKVANTYCADQTDREDLVQEIALQVWLCIETFDPKYKWSTWIYRVALNTAISFYRSNRKRKEHTVALPALVALPIREEEERGASENYLLLRQFIRALKEVDRALILLHLEGLSGKEISEVLGLTQTNVTTKLSRIKKSLNQKFQAHKTKKNGRS